MEGGEDKKTEGEENGERDYARANEREREREIEKRKRGRRDFLSPLLVTGFPARERESEGKTEERERKKER